MKIAGISIRNFNTKFEGLVPMLQNLDFDAYFGDNCKNIESHLPFMECRDCHGTRLRTGKPLR